jgi:hypothetical protein
MLNTNTKSQFGNAQVGPSEAYLRMKCPDCDRRRSGPCTHPSIPNLKGNSK